MGDFNSRLIKRFQGETSIIGDYAFYEGDIEIPVESNRELLISHCITSEFCIANTFFDHESHAQVTYHDLKSNPSDVVSPLHFGQIDFVLCDAFWLSHIKDIRSDRTCALDSHHFLVIMDIQLDIKKEKKKQNQPGHLSFEFLQNDHDRVQSFQQDFLTAYNARDQDRHGHDNSSNLNTFNQIINESMHMASVSNVPYTEYKPKRPWISEKTLKLIAERDLARTQNFYDKEKELSHLI
eukprot:7581345-Karenia_brevis.AAC.1